MVKGKVYILESRHHGSNQQLEVIAKNIFSGHETVSKRFELRSRSKLFRVLCTVLIRLKRFAGGSGGVSRTLSWLALRNGFVAVTDQDILIAKTPPFEYPLALLAAGTRAKTVFLGTPKHFSPADFDIVVSTPSTHCACADIVLETLPTETQISFPEIGEEDGAMRPVWALVIGGDAKGYCYSAAFYRHLLTAMKKISAVLGVRWIVSTSPRTPAVAESDIAAFVKDNPDLVEKSVLWGKGERMQLHDIYARSEAALVTEDSASMVSAAVNQKLRTVCVRPDDAGFNSLVTPLLESLEKKRRILRVDMSSLVGDDPKNLVDFEFYPLRENWVDSWLFQSRDAQPGPLQEIK